MKLIFLLNLAATTLCSSNIPLPAYPLAVRTPYLSTWFAGGSNATTLPNSCPMFWTSAQLTWNVIALVNGQAYNLFGCPDSSIQAADQVSLEFTATHTLLTVDAGSTSFQLDFFSPVSLTDYVRQSIPYSYLTVTVQSSSYYSEIAILSAIDDTWTAQSNTQLSLSETNSSIIYILQGVDSIPFTELNDMATYGRVVLAADSTTGSVSFQSGSSSDVKTQFVNNGRLNSSEDSSNSYTSGQLVALAYNLGVFSETKSVSFAIGLERDQAINWLSAPQAPYYKSELTTTEDTVDHFFSDESAARSEASNLDARVENAGSSISSNYTDVLNAIVRQTFGGMEIVVPADTLDTNQAKGFMKEISTDGNVNTIADLLPKALPAFYFLAPDYIRLLLEPIMEYTSQWPADFMFHDLGKSYPNATGETVAGEEALLLDQTSVIHWLAYAYQKASGNTDWVKPYLPQLQVYADYLVQNGLYPPSQKSAVDSIAATPNQTVLAIYSAIGLTSFGELSSLSNYTETGKQYAEKIIQLGLDSTGTHIRAHYDDPDSSWITTYPFGFDKLLDLDTFNETTYTLQSTWYEEHLHPLGLQFYSGVNYTVAEIGQWAGVTSSNQVRDALINGIHGFLTDGLNSVPGPTQWYVTGGTDIGEWLLSKAKSNVGSYFFPAIFTT